MNDETEKDIEDPCPCELQAECINIVGNRNMFNAVLVRYSPEELVLISKTLVKPGINLLVRIMDFPRLKSVDDYSFLRSFGLAEVKRVEEVEEDDVKSYALGLKYIHVY